MPQSRQRCGSAYVAASSGIVAWKAVSKTATCGTSGNACSASVDRAHRRRVVQRRERLELVDLSAHVVVDQHRLAEAGAAVDDAMCHGTDMSEGLSPGGDRTRRVVVLDDVQLQARRTRIDYEYGQTQSRTSGWSSPCSRVHAR